MTIQRAAFIVSNTILERAIVIKLRSLGIDVRVLARSESRAERLLTLGASEAMAVDLCSRDDLVTCLEGVDALIYDPSTSLPSADAEMDCVVAAAKRVGLPHTMFLSCFRPLTGGFAGFQVRARGEALLAASGLTYSVLQPAMLMQNIGFLLPDVRATDVLRWPWDITRAFAMVDALDVAEAIVQVAIHPALVGGTYELCGASATALDIVDRLAELTGRRVSARRGDVALDLRQRRIDVSPGWTPDTLSGCADDFDVHGYPGGNGFVLSKILQREPTGIDVFLRRDAMAYLSLAQKDAVPDSLFLDAMFESWAGAQL